MRFQHLIHVPLRWGLVKLATLNLVLLGGQPKLFEDPFSFSFHYFLYLPYFWLWDPKCVYVFILVCFSFKFLRDAREEKIWR